jgi:hypothetical protein
VSFDLKGRFFRWSAAIADQLNDVFSDFETHSNTGMSTEQLEPRSIESRHCSEPLTYALSETQRRCEGVNPAVPLCDVEYDAAVSAEHKIVLFGFFWPRRPSATGGTHGFSGTAEDAGISHYDSVSGLWDTSYRGTNLGQGAVTYVADEAMWGDNNTASGIYTTSETFLFEHGGGLCVHSSMVRRSDSGDWPPAGENPTKFGLFGQDSNATIPRAGIAELWALIEDKDS